MEFLEATRMACILPSPSWAEHILVNKNGHWYCIIILFF